nr:ATP-binding cassette domain-containing protein [Petrachloros mirabilis]
MGATAQSASVLRRINLTIADGEFMVLVGPSGCGKSTLLRLIAGLETLTGGNIWVGDRKVNDLPPKARDCAMVFQSYALYPHMTVYDNLAFGLRRTQSGFESPVQRLQRQLAALEVAVTRPFPKAMRYQSVQERRIAQRVSEVAQMLELEPLLGRLPKQLSGGQKQRVALGRAMARNPQVFLMDEPLSNLDAKLRSQTRAQIVKLQRQLGTTTIYVTHDQTEAMTMGDRIAVMNGGQIQQIAAPLELYDRPANQFVAAFIGSPPMNFLTVQVKSPRVLWHPHFQLCLAEGWHQVLAPYQGQSLTLGVRPEHVQVVAESERHLRVQVELIEALGHETYVTVALADLDEPAPRFNIRVAPTLRVSIADPLGLSLNPETIHLFDPQTGEALQPLRTSVPTSP